MSGNDADDVNLNTKPLVDASSAKEADELPPLMPNAEAADPLLDSSAQAAPAAVAAPTLSAVIPETSDDVTASKDAVPETLQPPEPEVTKTTESDIQSSESPAIVATGAAAPVGQSSEAPVSGVLLAAANEAPMKTDSASQVEEAPAASQTEPPKALSPIKTTSPPTESPPDATAPATTAASEAVDETPTAVEPTTVEANNSRTSNGAVAGASGAMAAMAAAGAAAAAIAVKKGKGEEIEKKDLEAVPSKTEVVPSPPVVQKEPLVQSEPEAPSKTSEKAAEGLAAEKDVTPVVNQESKDAMDQKTDGEKVPEEASTMAATATEDGEPFHGVQGILVKPCRHLSNHWVQRFYTLTPDGQFSYRISEADPKVKKNFDLNKDFKILLESVNVVPPKDSKVSSSGGFSFIIQVGPKTMTFSTNSQEKRTAWLKALERFQH